jgi:type VI secretion system protein ImpL
LLAYLLATIIIVIAAALAFGLAALLHLQGLTYVLFVVILLLFGIAAAVTIVVMHHRNKKRKEFEGDPGDTGARSELDLLLNDANRKLRESQQGAKTLESLPLIYILGDPGSAKTTMVLQSGLEPELLAGSASQGGEQSPTQILNLWYTRFAAFLEIGPAIRQSGALLARLMHRTRATAYRSAFGTGAPPRAVIVCISADQLLAPQGADSLLVSARTSGAQLREISRVFGMPVPVYVIVTKVDRVPHFEEYVRNLSEDEVRQVLGAPLGSIHSSAGTYADQASQTLSAAMDALVFKLGGFRVEMLHRENEAGNVAGVYEFPREFGKLRKNLSQYLVELCKPSQLSANPYLRGFYFTGVRARVVERVAAAPAAAQAPVAKDTGATQFLNLSSLRAQAAGQTASPVITSARVPQWTFLPRLLPEAILGDKSALISTRQSAPARLFRRILFGSLAFVFAVFTIMILISYVKNAALERRIREDARALPVESATATPTLNDLRTMDDLRQVIGQLDDFEHNGAPLSYRFGLYQGKELRERARHVYFDRFRPIFLNPTQQDFAKFLQALPDVPQTSSDTSSYLAAYNPLKAYLITTNHPEKSQTTFLTPIFFQYWKGTRTIDPDQEQLAEKQIDFYGNELLRKPPYAIDPDVTMVVRTQAYLSKFLANTRIYQTMLTDADKKNPRGIDFNRQYPDAVRYVSDSYKIRGAYTRDGFTFMKDALQHPERYAQGEKWVLGDQGGSNLDVAGIGKDLTAQYSSNYLKEWHQFLTSAHVAPCGGVREAPKELAALSGNSSPILELLSVISHNTAVDDQAIKSIFQPAQSLVDPNATDKLIGAGNADYIKALGDLELALEQASAQSTQLATDAAAFAPVSAAVFSAKAQVQKAAGAFNIDRDTHTDALITGLISQPIDCVGRLQPSPGAPANGGGAKICSAIDPLLGKFPFASKAQAQASLPEVDSVFAPETGVLWTTYATALKPFLVQTGPQLGAPYAQAPNAPGQVNPRFVAYFNRAARVSSELYGTGQKTASFSFTLRFIPGSGVSNASIVVDGQKIQTGAGAQQFTWNGRNAQNTSLVYDNNEAFSFQGPWSLFQMIRTAQVSRSGAGYKLEYPINTSTTIAGHKVGGTTSSSKTATFELSGTGADLLVGDAFAGLSCVRPVVAK